MNLGSLMPFGKSHTPAHAGNGDPFQILRRDMDRLFDEFTRGWGMPAAAWSSGTEMPRADVAETEMGLEISVDLPGIDPKEVELNLEDDVLALKAEHKSEKEQTDEKKQYQVIERSYGSFLRRFPLPFEPDADKVQASFKNGVLKIVVPRSAEAERHIKKIAVKGG